MTQNIKEEIMELKIFNEKIIKFDLEQKNQELERAHDLFRDGEKGLSLNQIIKSRSSTLDEVIFELDQSAEQIENSSIKRFVKINVKQIEEDGDKVLVQLIDMTEHMLLSELQNKF